MVGVKDAAYGVCIHDRVARAAKYSESGLPA